MHSDLFVTESNYDITFNSDCDGAESSDKLRELCSQLLIWQQKHNIPDNSLENLLKLINSNLITKTIIPVRTSLYAIRKVVDLQRNEFERSTVCPECRTVYTMEEAPATNFRGEK